MTYLPWRIHVVWSAHNIGGRTKLLFVLYRQKNESGKKLKKKRSADWSNFVRPFMLSFSATFQCSLCIQQLLCASLIEWKPVSLLNLLFIFCYPFTCLVGTLAGLSAVPLVQRDIICDNHVTTSSLFLAWDRKKNRVSFGSCRTHQ